MQSSNDMGQPASIKHPFLQKSVAAILAQSKKTGHFAGHLKNIGHLTGLQKPISLHLLGIIVSRQYSKSSDVGGQ